MRVISINTNGIRSAHRKGFYTWLARQKADFVCIQETKAQTHQLCEASFMPRSYHCNFVDAQKKGYSGVALFSRLKPDRVVRGLGWSEADAEGRFIQADFAKLSVISMYLPSGSSGEIRQAFKFKFLDYLMPRLRTMRRQRRHFIICGDWNIAHRQIDIKNWRGNQKNSGFLPEERAWMTELFEEVGFVDAFRVRNEKPDQYTWWSNRGRAWEKNVGWRIDYQVVSPALRDTVQRVSIYKNKRFSDHAPLIIDYDYPLAIGG